MDSNVLTQLQRLNDLEIDELRALATTMGVEHNKNNNGQTIRARIEASWSAAVAETQAASDAAAEAEIAAAESETVDGGGGAASGPLMAATAAVEPDDRNLGPYQQIPMSSEMLAARAEAAAQADVQTDTGDFAPVEGYPVWMVVDRAASKTGRNRDHILSAEGHAPLDVTFTGKKAEAIPRPYALTLVGYPDFMVMDETGVEQTPRQVAVNDADNVVSLHPDQIVARLDEMTEDALRTRSARMHPENPSIGLMNREQLIQLIRNSGEHRRQRAVSMGVPVSTGPVKQLTPAQAVGPIETQMRVPGAQVVDVNGRGMLSASPRPPSPNRDGDGVLNLGAL